MTGDFILQGGTQKKAPVQLALDGSF